MLGQHGVDERRVAARRAPLVHGGPVRPVQLHLVVPLGVVKGVRDRLAALALVERDAGVLVRKEFAAEDPDLLRVVAGGLDLDLVDELHQPDALADLALARTEPGIGRLPVDRVARPDEAVVVAVGDAQALQHAQTGQLAPLSEQFEQREPEVERQPAVACTIGDRGVKALDDRVDRGVAAVRAGVEQRQRRALEQLDCRVLGRRAHGPLDEAAPQPAHAGEAARRAPLDARILDEADEEALRRRQRLGRLRRARVDQVRRHVRGHRAVQVDPAAACEVVGGIGQVQRARLDERAPAGVVGRRRAQEEVAPPEGAQVEDEPALAVDEQRAAALALQHRAAVLGLQPEVRRLPRQVAPVGLGAEVDPAPQPRQRQLAEQLVERAEHRPQAARRARREPVQQRQVGAQQFGVAEPARGGRQRREDQRQHLARDERGEVHHRVHGVADHRLAALARDQRHLVEVGLQQRRALAQPDQPARTVEPVLQPGGRHGPRGLVEARVQRRGQRRRGAQQLVAVVVELEVHGAAAGFGGARGAIGISRRRCRPRRPASRACRGRRSAAAPAPCGRRRPGRCPWRSAGRRRSAAASTCPRPARGP